MILKQFTLTATSPASATTAASTMTIGGLRQYDWFTVDANLSATTTNGTLDVYLQRYVEKTSTWVDWIHFAQIASGATLRVTIDSKETETGPVTVGTGTSPALAAGKFSCSHPGDRVRFLFVAGSGTDTAVSNSVTITCHAQSR